MSSGRGRPHCVDLSRAFVFDVVMPILIHCLNRLHSQTKLDEERQQVMLLKQNHEHLEDDLRGYKIRNREYEEGLYGLPQVGPTNRGASHSMHHTDRIS